MLNNTINQQFAMPASARPAYLARPMQSYGLNLPSHPVQQYCRPQQIIDHRQVAFLLEQAVATLQRQAANLKPVITPQSHLKSINLIQPAVPLQLRRRPQQNPLSSISSTNHRKRVVKVNQKQQLQDTKLNRMQLASVTPQQNSSYFRFMPHMPSSD